MPLTKSQLKLLFSQKRYWYHVSTTLRKRQVLLTPWDEGDGFNRGQDEPQGKRICVAPTIEQCITAIPYYLSANCSIYRTKDEVKASPPVGVWDAHITEEGWLTTPTEFILIGKLNFELVEKKLNIDNVIEEAASDGNEKNSRKVLRWWRRAKIERFIKHLTSKPKKV